MEFQRRKTKGRRQDTYKQWVSDCGFFRISWHKEYDSEHYHACVRVESKHLGERWEFTMRRDTYRTYNAALESCVKYKKFWDAFVQLSHATGRRDGKLQSLKARAPMVFANLPLWVRAEAKPDLMEMLWAKPKQNQDEDTTDSDTSSWIDLDPNVSESAIDLIGPASNAEDEESSSNRDSETCPPGGSPGCATPAKGPAKERKKRSKTGTSESTKPSSKTSKPGKPKKASGKADSTSSPKKRKKP